MYLLYIFLIILAFKISFSHEKYHPNSTLNINQNICGTENCNAERGICYMDTCFCHNGFTTIKGSDKYCDYKMKNHYVALLLEFFFPFGVGHFYAENYLLGSLKLAFFIFLLVSFCLFYNYFTGEMNMIKTNKLVYIIITYLFSIAIYFLWNLVDILLFGFNIYKDGNNIIME